MAGSCAFERGGDGISMSLDTYLSDFAPLYDPESNAKPFLGD